MGQSERRLSERILFILLVITLKAQEIHPQEFSQESTKVTDVPTHIVSPQPGCPSEGYFGHPRQCSWYYKCAKHDGQECFSRTYFLCSNETVFCDVAKRCVVPMEAVTSCNRTHHLPSNPSVVNMYAQNIINIGSVSPGTNIIVMVDGKNSSETVGVPINVQSQQSTPNGCANSTHMPVSGNVYITIGGSSINPSYVDLKPPTTGYISNNQTGVINLTPEETAQISPENAFSVQCLLSYDSCQNYSVCYNSESTLVSKTLCKQSSVNCQMLSMNFPLCPEASLYNINDHECVYRTCPYSANETKVTLPTGMVPGEKMTESPLPEESTAPPSISPTITPTTTDKLTTTTEVHPSSEKPAETNADTTTVKPTETSTEDTVECTQTYEYCNMNEACKIPLIEAENMYSCKQGKYKCSNGTESPLCEENQLYNPIISMCVSTNCKIYPSMVTEQTFPPQEVTTSGPIMVESSTILLVTESSETLPEGFSSSTTTAEALPEITATTKATTNVFPTQAFSSTTGPSQCFFYYRYCRDITTCDEDGNEKDVYLCKQSFSECGNEKDRIEACEEEDLYNPKEKACVSSVCPYTISKPPVFSTTEATIQKPSSIATTGELVSTTDTDVTSKIPPLTSTTSVPEPTISSSTPTESSTVAVASGSLVTESTSSEAHVGTTESAEPKPGSIELEEISTSTSTMSTSSSPTTLAETSSSILPVTESSPPFVSTTTTSTTAPTITTPLSTVAPTTTTTPPTPAPTTTTTTAKAPFVGTAQCIFYYKYCARLPTCNEAGSQNRTYMCRQAYSECGPDKVIVLACVDGEIYNPIAQTCVFSLCPYKDYQANVVTTTVITTTESSETSSTTISSSITSEMSYETTLGEQVSTAQPSIDVVEVQQCTVHYKDCIDYTTCDTRGAKDRWSLCNESYSECGPTGIITDLCPDGQLYNPRDKRCVISLCPYEGVLVDIKNQTHMPITTSAPSIGTDTQTSSSSTTGDVVGDLSTETFLPLTMTTQETTHSATLPSSLECTFYYKYCRLLSTCDENGNENQAYLCIESYSQCGSSEQRINACGKEELYNPQERSCVSSLCPYSSYKGTIAPDQTNAISTTESIQTSAVTAESTVTIMETPSPSISSSGESTVESSTTSTTSGEGTDVINAQCIFYYKYCTMVKACDSEGTETEKYLCREAFSECGPLKEKINACARDSLYDPLKQVCVESLCPYEVLEAIIVSTATSATLGNQTTVSISTVETSTSSGTSSETVATTEDSSSVGDGNDNVSSTPSISITEDSSVIGVITVQCSFSYKYCTTITTCDDKGSVSRKYLCKESFSECGPQKKKVNACEPNELYNPQEQTCARGICPYEVSSAIVLNSTSIQVSEGTEITSPETITPTASTGGSSGNEISPSTEAGENTTINTTDSPIEEDSGEFMVVSCTFFYKFCKFITICNNEGDEYQMYLCRESYSECGPNKRKTEACSHNHLYNPQEQVCVGSLCPYSISEATILTSMKVPSNSSSSSLTESTFIDNVTDQTVTNESQTITETTVSTDSSSITGEDLSGDKGNVSTTFSTVRCTFYYKFCTKKKTCDTAGVDGERYLCREAYSECGDDKIRMDACEKDFLYDPKQSKCVSSLCPLTVIEATIVTSTTIEISSNITTTIETTVSITNSSSEVVESKPGSVGIGGAVVTIDGSGSETTTDGHLSTFITIQCTFSYRYCSWMNTCDPKMVSTEMYLCKEAFSECGLQMKKMDSCKKGNYYNPQQRTCVSSLCPLTETQAIIISSTTIKNTTTVTTTDSTSSTSSSSETSEESSEVVIVDTNEVSLNETDSSSTDETSGGNVLTVTCTFYYKYCKPVKTCDDQNLERDRYLCREAYSECGSENKRMNACKANDLYNPRSRACVTTVCPYSSYEATIITSTTFESISSSNVTTTTVHESSSSSTEETDVSEGTINFGNVITVQCTFYYKFCKSVTICDDDEVQSQKYLCREAYSECGPEQKRLDACKRNDLYNPKDRICVYSVCPYTPYEAVIISTASYESNSTNESSTEASSTSVETEDQVSSGSVGESHEETDVPGSSMTVECTFYYKFCSSVMVCDENQVQIPTYLCRESYSECGPDKKRMEACRNGDLYNPQNRACVSSVCPYSSYEAVIYSITSIEVTQVNGSSSTQTSTSEEATSQIITVDSSGSTSGEIGESESTLTVQCVFYYKKCRSVTVCDNNQTQRQEYLCRESYSECGPNKKRMDACETGELYNPKERTCISSTCPYTSYGAIIISSSGIGSHTGSNTSTSVSSSTSTSQVETTDSSESSQEVQTSSTLITVECTFYYKLCQSLEVCDDDGVPSTSYLCRESYSECGKNKKRMNACENEEFYNPKEKSCVPSVCPYTSYQAVIISTTSGISIGSNTTTSQTSSSTSTSQEGSIESSGSTSQEIEESDNLITVQCTFYYKFCSMLEVCNENDVKTQKYLCREAYSECGPGKKRLEACSKGEFYNPRERKCVSSLCPYISYEAVIVTTTEVEASIVTSTTVGSGVDSSGSSESSSSSGVVSVSIGEPSSVESANTFNTTSFTTIQCTFYYKFCANVETCDKSQNQHLVYLCKESYSECGPDKRIIEACTKGNLYNPFDRSCVTNVCPYTSSQATVPGDGVDESSLEETIPENSEEQGMNGVVTGSDSQSTGADIETTSLFTIECTFYYKLCTTVSTCDQTQTPTQTYLCKEAYSECGPNKKKMNTCSKSELYNPKTRECVLAVCPYDSYQAVIVNSTASDSSTVISSIVSGSITGGSQTVTNEVTSSEPEDTFKPNSTSTLLTTQCTFFYKYCTSIIVCDENQVEKAKYLCKESYSECGPENIRFNACRNQDLYSPEEKSCVSEVCPYSSYQAEVVDSSGGDSSSSSSTIGSESSTTSQTSSTQTTETGVRCYLSYRLCRNYETCSESSDVSQNLYLCREAFSECKPQKVRQNACSEGELYSPQTRQCAVSLCPLKLVEASIIKVFTHNSTVQSSSESSVVVSTNTSNNSGSDGIVSTGEHESTVTTSTFVSIKCYLSYSLCKNYDTCTNDIDTPQRTYLCKEAFSECNPGSLKQTACKYDTLFDPKSKQCVSSLCPMQSTKATIANASQISLSSHMNLANLTQSTYYQSIIVRTNYTQAGQLATGSVVFDEFSSSYIFTCQFQYSSCSIEKLCATANMPAKEMVLCKEATTNCSINPEVVSLCPDGEFYSPERKACVSSTCPYEDSSISLSFNSGFTITIEKNSIQSQSIYTLIDSIVGNDQEVSSSVATSVSIGCTLAYQFCRNYAACLSTGETKELYLCREATEKCEGGIKGRDLCEDSKLYNPQEHKCVSLICPLMWKDALEVGDANQNKNSGSTTTATTEIPEGNDIINEIDEPIITKNRTKTILNIHGERQVMQIYCQLDLTKCRHERVCSEALPRDDLFCRASEICYFRQQEISRNDYCAPGTAFNPESKSCMDLNKERESCPPAILRGLSDSTNEIVHVSQKNELLASNNYDVVPLPYNLECSTVNLRPSPKSMEDAGCIKNVICSIDGFIKVFKMSDVCDNYVQCVEDGNVWKVAEMKCPDGLYFSYAEDKCVAPPLSNNCRFWVQKFLK